VHDAAYGGDSRLTNDLAPTGPMPVGGQNDRDLFRRQRNLELLERKFALQGDGASAADLTLYCTVANSRRRQLESIGIKRASPLRDITPPSLADIRREMDARKASLENEDGA